MKLYIKNTDNNNYSEIACNYASLNIYNADTEKVLYTTCRLTGSTSLDFDLYIDSNIRSARKLNLKKNDIFEVKTTTKDTFMNNGKDLYIPDAIIKIVSQEEKLALEANGCKDYKQVYAIEFIGCKAYKTTRHSEIVDFPEGTKRRYKMSNLLRICGHNSQGKTLLFTDADLINNALHQEQNGIKPHYAWYDYKTQKPITPKG